MIMLRAGRFRHRLLDDEFLKNHSPLAFEVVQKFVPLWKDKTLSDVEMAALYIFVFSFLRRPKDFLGGVHNQSLDHTGASCKQTSSQIMNMLRDQLPSSLKDQKSLQRMHSSKPFVEHFCSLSWRSIPLSVGQSLCAWSSGRYDLRLLTDIPSPGDVLSMQAQGQRCISMLLEKDQICHFVEEGRDVLGFIIHDLIHADHFFADPIKAHAQIFFCQKLLTVRGLPQIETMLKADPLFRNEFHYLMSDMNSVPLHLLKTLKAILLGFYKRRENTDMTAPLSGPAEQEFLALFQDVLRPWQFSTAALEAALRLNTPLYKGLADGETLHQALLLNFSDEPVVSC